MADSFKTLLYSTRHAMLHTFFQNCCLKTPCQYMDLTKPGWAKEFTMFYNTLAPASRLQGQLHVTHWANEEKRCKCFQKRVGLSCDYLLKSSFTFSPVHAPCGYTWEESDQGIPGRSLQGYASWLWFHLDQRHRGRAITQPLDSIFLWPFPWKQHCCRSIPKHTTTQRITFLPSSPTFRKHALMRVQGELWLKNEGCVQTRANGEPEYLERKKQESTRPAFQDKLGAKLRRKSQSGFLVAFAADSLICFLLNWNLANLVNSLSVCGQSATPWLLPIRH